MSTDTPSTDLLNYFFYKCGQANCWLPVALEGYGMYVGLARRTAAERDASRILGRAAAGGGTGRFAAGSPTTSSGARCAGMIGSDVVSAESDS